MQHIALYPYIHAPVRLCSVSFLLLLGSCDSHGSHTALAAGRERYKQCSGEASLSPHGQCFEGGSVPLCHDDQTLHYQVTLCQFCQRLPVLVYDYTVVALDY